MMICRLAPHLTPEIQEKLLALATSALETSDLPLFLRLDACRAVAGICQHIELDKIPPYAGRLVAGMHSTMIAVSNAIATAHNKDVSCLHLIDSHAAFT